MKLITCAQCGDVVALIQAKTRKCECGLCGGRYVDNLNAEVWGPCVTIGFENSSFYNALRNRPEPFALGSEFKAFIIPELCNTIKHIPIPPDHREKTECFECGTELHAAFCPKCDPDIGEDAYKRGLRDGAFFEIRKKE